MPRKKKLNPKVALATWEDLNRELMECEDEDALNDLLAVELRGKQRAQFARRIYSRFSKVRGERERSELEGAIRG